MLKELKSNESLRKHLLEQLEQSFPFEVEGNREIRARSAAESKQLAREQSVLPNGDVKVKSELYPPCSRDNLTY
ncbi:Mediator of RNA polymerase II transcription subunit 10a [Ancistrocladus abbreviatus]